MFKTLRIKTTAAVCLSAAIIFCATFFIVYGCFNMYYASQADAMTLIISDYNGDVPASNEYENNYGIEITDETEYSTRYFIVYVKGEEAVSVDMAHIVTIDKGTACEMAETVLGRKKDTGYISVFRFRKTEDSVIFLDCSSNFVLRNMLVNILGFVSIIFPILITFIFWLISNKILKPFEENTERQKQFITDAGHELKTPLAVISANAAALEYRMEENKWLKNIQAQTDKMGRLINDLLSLAKMDEAAEIEKSPCNISDMVFEMSDSISTICENKGVSLKTDINEDIIVNGDPRQLSILVSTLFENASKYVSENGKINISLTQNNRYAYFYIYNTAVLSDDLDINKLFIRFYRADSSRNSETGGHGIGLSAALKIAQLHGGRITAKKEEGGIAFTATIRKK